MNDNDKLINQIFIDLKTYLKNNLNETEIEKERSFLETSKISDFIDDMMTDVDKYFMNDNHHKLFFKFLRNLDYDIPHSVYVNIDIIKMMQHALITL